MIRSIAIFVGAWLLCVVGYALHLWLQPISELSSSTQSALNLIATLLSEPVLALAQTLPAFIAAYQLRGKGWLIGAGVSGIFMLIQVTNGDSFGDLRFLRGEGVLLYSPGLAALSHPLAAIVLGALAGMAGQRLRSNSPSNQRFERSRDASSASEGASR
jgi:hypothetical protein